MWYSVGMHLLLLFYVIARITERVTTAATRDFVTGGIATPLTGEGFEKTVALQSKQEGRQPFPGTAHSSIDQQHRTIFCALKDARSSYKPAIFMDSGCLVDTSLEVLGGEDCALAG